MHEKKQKQIHVFVLPVGLTQIWAPPKKKKELHVFLGNSLSNPNLHIAHDRTVDLRSSTQLSKL